MCFARVCEVVTVRASALARITFTARELALLVKPNVSFILHTISRFP